MDMFVMALTTAVSVGLGCGTCCSPIMSTFLSTYVVSHSGGVKKGVLSFVSFFFWKNVQCFHAVYDCGTVQQTVYQ